MSSSIVTIDLTRHPPSAPLGMLLAPGAGGGSASTQSGGETLGNYFASHAPPTTLSPASSNVTLVAGWEHDSSSGRHLGPIQRSGLVRLGDRLVRINGKDVTDWTFREVMDALKELVASSKNSAPAHKRRLKTLGFAPAGTSEWSRGTHQTATISDSMFFGLFSNPLHQQTPQGDDAPSQVIHSKRKYSFVSSIGRWRVAPGQSSFAEPVEKNVQQQSRQDSGNSEQIRQQSENSTSDLERQLNKEPSIKYHDGPALPVVDQDSTGPQTSASPPPAPALLSSTEGNPATALQSTASSSPKANEKPYIQYEIACHILFRDTSSFGNNPNDVHHSWSVWKRFSELQTLDEELRYDFGWQMDALHDGRGFSFPRSHGLESWWYGVRNGGGVLTSILGESSGIQGDNEGADAHGGEKRVDHPASVITGINSGGEHVQEDGGGWGSSLTGWFRTSSNSDGSTNKMNGANSLTAKGRSAIDQNGMNNPPHDGSHNCPYPPAFLDKRQKELSAYWTDLMNIEDIFEFGDVHSHKFGKAMAKFLEVDKVLMSRKTGGLGNAMSPGGGSSVASGQRQDQLLMPSKNAFPAIHEDETEMFGTTFRPSYASSLTQTREVSGLTAFENDDVSILSDGTGAFGESASHNVNRDSPIRERPMVDVVPKHYSNGNATPEANVGGDSRDDNGAIDNPEKRVVSSSVASASGVTRGSRRRTTRGRGMAPKAKPAFQRQFLTP